MVVGLMRDGAENLGVSMIMQFVQDKSRSQSLLTAFKRGDIPSLYDVQKYNYACSMLYCLVAMTCLIT
jgi:hypothetical protein